MFLHVNEMKEVLQLKIVDFQLCISQTRSVLFFSGIDKLFPSLPHVRIVQIGRKVLLLTIWVLKGKSVKPCCTASYNVRFGVLEVVQYFTFSIHNYTNSHMIVCFASSIKVNLWLGVQVHLIRFDKTYPS